MHPERWRTFFQSINWTVLFCETAGLTFCLTFLFMSCDKDQQHPNTLRLQCHDRAIPGTELLHIHFVLSIGDIFYLQTLERARSASFNTKSTSSTFIGFVFVHSSTSLSCTFLTRPVSDIFKSVPCSVSVLGCISLATALCFWECHTKSRWTPSSKEETNIKTTCAHRKKQTWDWPSSLLHKRAIEQVEICTGPTEKPSDQNQHQPEIKAVPVNHPQMSAQGWWLEG